ncbi:phosphoenolpyruvate--protein phosphotransferase [bacterium]|nr:phosphoenolpyruvate--protein phosphotransferase [bacterium]
MKEQGQLTKGLLQGIPVSEGIAIGKVWLLKSPWDEVRSFTIAPENIKIEILRFEKACDEVAEQLKEYQDRVELEIGSDEAQIFNAHFAILEDPTLKDEVPRQIQDKFINAESVLKDSIEKLTHTFNSMENEFFRSRIDDIRDVGERILRALLRSDKEKHPFFEETILVSHTLSPSDTARISNEKIIGFVTEVGGITSHASILARSLGLPAVVGVEKIIRSASTGDIIIVDGNSGIVFLNPHEKVLKGYRKRKKQFDVYWERLSKDIDLPSVTADHVDILLQANISMTADLSMAVRYKAQGIGLFRTELPFLIASRLLNEEEQFTIYKTIVDAMQGKDVTIRTLDLGGDKFLPFQGVEREKNPFMGWRSIRISLLERDVFKVQLRAILRSSVFGKVKILFPMISSIEEVVEAKEVLSEVMDDLDKEEISFDRDIKTGVMIEVPSAAIMVERFLEYFDFISIGTNDLIQYTLAVDRNNERVAKFYQPLNPSVLYLVEKSIKAANKQGKEVSVCGEMAGNPLYTPMFIGFGLRRFSMSPLMLPEVKERVRFITVKECEDIAEKIMKMHSTAEIEKLLWDFNNEINKRQEVPFIDKYNLDFEGTE